MPNSPVRFEADSTQENCDILILTFCARLLKRNNKPLCWSVPTFAAALRHFDFKHFPPCLKEEKKNKIKLEKNLVEHLENSLNSKQLL